MNTIFPRDNTLSNQDVSYLTGNLNQKSPLERAKIYTELVYRINESQDVEPILFDAIRNENNRQENFWGFIKVAWIPVIGILDSKNQTLIDKTKEILLKNWSSIERKNLHEYVKKRV